MKNQNNVLAVVIAIASFAALDGCRLSVADNIETAGDILQLVIPATAGGA